MAKRPRKIFNSAKEVRAIARERVGTVKPGHAIIPKDLRKPKHKPDLLRDSSPSDQ